MNVLIIYDIEPIERNPEIRVVLRNSGFFRGWVFGGKKYFLPKFSLYKINTDLVSAKALFTNVIKEYNIKNPSNRIEIKRLIVVPATSWEGIEGEEFED